MHLLPQPLQLSWILSLVSESLAILRTLKSVMKVVIDIDPRFPDLKLEGRSAHLDQQTGLCPNALTRPIVTFMRWVVVLYDIRVCVLSRWIGANCTLFPVRCQIVKDMEHFDGTWMMVWF